MTTSGLGTREEILALVDPEKGLVARKIFSDQEIYDLELDQIFGRAWNFMAHDSQIPKAGDFFLTRIGDDRVIVVRDKDGQPQVLLNTCRHRGNAVCRADEGHASSFMCTYHGWTYDLKGNLVGVPGFHDNYNEELNREEWGLIKAAQVDTFKGFIFATLDSEAPPLHDYLGEVGRMSLNTLALKGDIYVVEGVQKYVINCNWKFAADNVWDFYHGQITHASTAMSGAGRAGPGGNRNAPPREGALERRPPRGPMPHIIVLGEYGHVISGPEVNMGFRMGPDQSFRNRPEVKAELGPVGLKVQYHPHIFPNMWITGAGFGQVGMRMPMGPAKTEIWWFTILERSMTAAEKTDALDLEIHSFGPAGLMEQDDGENWDQSTRGTVGRYGRRFPLNYAMNIGRGQIVENEDGPPTIHTHVNEHAQLWHYRAWTEWMAANSWADLKANHSPVPSGFV